MSETAEMLRHAGSGSLLCFDELGAATSAREGSAIARAVVDHVRASVGGFVLVTTHFPDLPPHCNLQLAVDEGHRVRRGVAKSDALATARRYGLCAQILACAATN